MTPLDRGRGLRRALKPAAALALAVCAAGCGIRTTSVPVVGGAAPSRAACQVPGEGAADQARPGVPVQIYLMCASELRPVRRTAHTSGQQPPTDRRQMAQALLDELQAPPSAAEHEAGFATYVRGPLLVAGPRSGDPAGTLRLNHRPEDLPTAALAQIVCTFAEGGATDGKTDGKVVLGGPGDDPARGYGCDPETKRRPDSAVPTLGPVPSE